MRIAVLGLGFMGSTHLKAWSKLPGVSIAAVSSGDDRKLSGDLSEVQGNLGGPGERYDFSAIGRYKSWSEAIQHPGVDAVDICLPTDLHSDAALAALRAGKHVLVEKPMALSGDVADTMVREAQRENRILMAAQVLRFLPVYRALAEAAESRRYGPVRTAVFRRRCAAPFWSKWLADPAKSGGGVFDLLIHDVDFCIKLFGTPEAVSATGYEDLHAGIDTLTATLFYQNIPSVVITGGWHHKKVFPFSMEYTVVMEGGTYEFNSARGEGVTLYNATGEQQEVALPEKDGFDAEIEYFHDCCAANKQPESCPPVESAAAVKVTLLLLESRTQFGEKIRCQF